MNSLSYKNISFKFIKRLLVVLDLIFLAIAFSTSYYLRLQHWPNFIASVYDFAQVQFLMVSCFYLFGCYSYDFYRFRWSFLLKVVVAVLVAFLVMSGIIYLSRAEIQGIMGRGIIIGGYSIFTFSALLYRFVILKWTYNQSKKQRWLVCLSDDFVLPFFKEIDENDSKDSYYFLTSSNNKAYEQVFGRRWLGSIQRLEAIIEEHNWSGLVVGMKEEDLNPHSQVLMNIRFSGLQTLNLTNFYEVRWQKVPVYFLSKSWFAFSQGFTLVSNPMGLRVKRFFDILGSMTLLLITFPLMLIFYIMIKIESRGAAIYKQKRVGRNNKVFTIYKFRSMHQDAESGGIQWAQKNDKRITLIGKFMRKTRIDELPQVFNVLKGEMSFIGPRPERPEFIEELQTEIPHYGLRHLLKPGITGWAQVKYRYGSTVEDANEKLQYDLFYIKDYSLLLDLSIIFKTLRIVLASKGV